MVQRGRGPELLEKAVSFLERCGYAVDDPPFYEPFGKNVRKISRAGVSENVLIQTRSNRKEDYRYLVGIIIPELNRVDAVVFWFEGESTQLKIPAAVLRDILKETAEKGMAKYTKDRQWRVIIRLDRQILSPQGTNGKDYPLAGYSL